jgi:hypothetical protein
MFYNTLKLHTGVVFVNAFDVLLIVQDDSITLDGTDGIRKPILVE